MVTLSPRIATQSNPAIGPQEPGIFQETTKTEQMTGSMEPHPIQIQLETNTHAWTKDGPV